MPQSLGNRALQLGSVLIGVAYCLSAGAENWQAERWFVEPFTRALNGGPMSGPAVQSGGGVDALCEGPDGSMFVASDQFIDIVTAEGVRYHIAGTGYPGFRDGPAHRAQFRLGFHAYRFYNIACASDGSVIIADDGNERVRRLARSTNGWFVETIAGGGQIRLQPGDEVLATDARLHGTFVVASTPAGEVYVALSHGYFRIFLARGTIAFIDKWPISVIRPGRDWARLNPFAGDADIYGNVYFASRTPDVIVRIDHQGRAQHIAGRLFRGKKPHHIGDTVPKEAYFDTPSGMAVRPDGSAVYIGGGDEYDIRRVPTEPTSSTATLMYNGRWYRTKVHPNAYRGPAVFDARVSGEPTKKFGHGVQNLMVSPIVGRDRAGNLYAELVPWRGMTQYIIGDGLLPTRVFRLRRNPQVSQ